MPMRYGCYEIMTLHVLLVQSDRHLISGRIARGMRIVVAIAFSHSVTCLFVQLCVIVTFGCAPRSVQLET